MPWKEAVATAVKDLRRKGYFTTYCQCFDIEVKKQTKKITKLIDARRKYPNIEFRQQNIAVKDDGIVHIVKSVLLPPLEEVVDPEPPIPAECPEGGDDCIFEPANPHICGTDFACYYETLCDLEAAGFDRDDDCCQQPGDDVFCKEEFNPVTCGPKECSYINLCWAINSGYDESQCTGEGACQQPGDDVFCKEEFNPVTCGAKKCPYDNLCWAINSGYDESQCTGGGSGRCRGPAPGAACSKKLNPVECGSGGDYTCLYDNFCLAKSAGWTGRQCSSAAE